MQLSDFKVLAIDTPEFKSAFNNVLFWRRYFHRDEIQKNEITEISDEEEFSVTNEAYFDLEEQKEHEYEVKSDYILFKNVLVKFEFSLGYSFLLDIHFPALYFLYPDGRITTIATNDEAHFTPDLFRFEELENICKQITKKYTYLEHPGIPFLLFWYYCPITKDVNKNDFYRVLTEAWKKIGINDEAFFIDFYELFENLASNHTNTEWHFDEKFGFLLDERTANKSFSIYTYRHKSNDNFPFAWFNNLLNKIP